MIQSMGIEAFSLLLSAEHTCQAHWCLKPPCLIWCQLWCKLGTITDADCLPASLPAGLFSCRKARWLQETDCTESSLYLHPASKLVSNHFLVHHAFLEHSLWWYILYMPNICGQLIFKFWSGINFSLFYSQHCYKSWCWQKMLI